MAGYMNRVRMPFNVNLAGYSPTAAVKAADLYQWMGNGGSRDYTGFAGAGFPHVRYEKCSWP